MKYNIVKKAFAVVLAAALVTTGMPVEMAGAGVVQAAGEYDSPSEVDLSAENVDVKASVSNTSGTSVYSYGYHPTAEDIMITIKENGTIVGKNTLDKWLDVHFKNKSSILQAISEFDTNAGDHTATLKLQGQMKLTGTRTVEVKYSVERPKSNFTFVDASGNTSDTISVKEKKKIGVGLSLAGVPASDELKDVEYVILSGDSFVSVEKDVDNCEASVTGVKAGKATIVAKLPATVNHDALTSNEFTLTVSKAGAGESDFEVAKKTLYVGVNETGTIVPRNFTGAVTYSMQKDSVDSETGVPTYASTSSNGVVELSGASSPIFTAKKVGQDTIYVTDSGGADYAATIIPVTVNVVDGKSDLTWNSSSVDLEVGETKDVGYTFTGDITQITKGENDPSIASATLSGTSYKITGASAGTTVITLSHPEYTYKGVTYAPTSTQLTVNVKGKANSFALETTSAKVKIGETIKVGYTGSNGVKVDVSTSEGNKEYMAVSDAISGTDPSVGSIEITGKKVAKDLTITLTDASDGTKEAKSQTLTVEVEGTEGSFTINPEKVESLTVNEKTTALYIGAAGTVTATPVSGTSGSVSALVNNGKIEITGLTAGDAAVAVKDSGSDTIAASEKTIAVTVVQRDSEFKLTETKADIKANGTANIGYTGDKGTVTTSIKSGDGVVKIDGTKVTGLKEGTAVITVTDPGNAEYKGASADFTVNVTKNASSFALNETSATVKYGGKYKIGWKNAAGTVYITSGTSAVATADNKGVVTIKKPGTASFTVKDAGSDKVAASTKTFKLTVAKATQNVTVGFKSGSTKVGGTAVYTISGLKTKVPTVKSGSTKVAKIKKTTKTQIQINCIKAGTSKITVTVPGNAYYNAVTKTFNIKVTAAPQNLTVKPSTVSLKSAGKTKKLKVTGAKNKVTYKTSNKKVAKVSGKGVITAVGKGSCTITVTAAKSNDYTKASKKVKVTVQK